MITQETIDAAFEKHMDEAPGSQPGDPNHGKFVSTADRYTLRLGFRAGARWLAVEMERLRAENERLRVTKDDGWILIRLPDRPVKALEVFADGERWACELIAISPEPPTVKAELERLHSENAALRASLEIQALDFEERLRRARRTD